LFIPGYFLYNGTADQRYMVHFFPSQSQEHYIEECDLLLPRISMVQANLGESGGTSKTAEPVAGEAFALDFVTGVGTGGAVGADGG
jgi:hypothetical protein